MSHADHQPPLVFDTFFLGREGLSLTGPAPDWLTTLKLEQEAVSEVVGGSTQWSQFHPHISLAYFGGEIDESALIAGAQQVGLADVVAIRPTLSLLELRRDGRLYNWRTLGERTLELIADR